MAERERTGYLGVILGGIVAAAAVIFLLTGGDLGGKTSVKSDADLPPVAKTVPPAE